MASGTSCIVFHSHDRTATTSRGIVEGLVITQTEAYLRRKHSYNRWPQAALYSLMEYR